MEFSRLHVYKIGESTATDLSVLFGFDKTEFIKGHTCVQLKKTVNNEPFALVLAPREVAEEVIKLNGVEFASQQLQIVPAEEANARHQQNQQQNTSTIDENEEEIIHFMLDCRNHPDLNFPIVSEAEVCDALMIDHSEDPLKTVKTLWGRNLGTFIIDSDDLQRYKGKSLVIRGHDIPLTPVFKTQRRQVFRDPEGIKIRIFDAFSRPFRHIDDSKFDEQFNQFGVEIIKTTRPERCLHNRDVFNQNRFIVVKKKNAQGQEVDFGQRITVDHCSFKISYYGMQKFCGACRRKHGRDCPREARERLLKEMRKDETGKCKVYSDSTFRHVNQYALTSDVACMTGGGIAQLCNVLPYDESHDSIVLNAGTNELKTESLHEFVYTIEKATDKLSKVAANVPTMVVLPAVKNATPTLKAKTEFLHEKIMAIGQVTTVVLENIELADDMGHPSVDGTKTAMIQVDAATGNNLIMQDCVDDVSFPQKYRKVQTLFKVGCRGCESLEFTHTLCSNCKEAAKKIDVSVLQTRIDFLQNEMYPQMNEVDMKERGKKRSNSSDGENELTKKPLNADK